MEEIFHEDRVNLHDSFGIVFALHDIAHGERPLVPAVLEIERGQHPGAHLVINLSWPFPLGKQ